MTKFLLLNYFRKLKFLLKENILQVILLTLLILLTVITTTLKYKDILYEDDLIKIIISINFIYFIFSIILKIFSLKIEINKMYYVIGNNLVYKFIFRHISEIFAYSTLLIFNIFIFINLINFEDNSTFVGLVAYVVFTAILYLITYITLRSLNLLKFLILISIPIMLILKFSSLEIILLINLIQTIYVLYLLFMKYTFIFSTNKSISNKLRSKYTFKSYLLAYLVRDNVYKEYFQFIIIFIGSIFVLNFLKISPVEGNSIILVNYYNFFIITSSALLGINYGRFISTYKCLSYLTFINKYKLYTNYLIISTVISYVCMLVVNLTMYLLIDKVHFYTYSTFIEIFVIIVVSMYISSIYDSKESSINLYIYISVIIFILKKVVTSNFTEIYTINSIMLFISLIVIIATLRELKSPRFVRHD